MPYEFPDTPAGRRVEKLVAKRIARERAAPPPPKPDPSRAFKYTPPKPDPSRAFTYDPSRRGEPITGRPPPAEIFRYAAAAPPPVMPPSEVVITRPSGERIVTRVEPGRVTEFVRSYLPTPTVMLPTKQAYRFGLISPEEAVKYHKGVKWGIELPSLGMALGLRKKYPKAKAVYPGERLLETFVKAERAKERQMVQKEGIARQKMEEAALQPVVSVSYVFGKPITAVSLGFEAATAGIVSLIQGKDVGKDIGKRIRQSLVDYTYQISEKREPILLKPGKMWEGVLPDIPLPYHPTMAALQSGAEMTVAGAGMGVLGAKGVAATKWAYRGVVGLTGYEFLKDPSLEKGVRLGLIAAPGVIGLARKHIKYTKVELPTDKGQAKVVYRGIGLEAGRRAQPLIGVGPGKGLGRIKLGTPDIPIEIAKGRFIFETPTQTKIFQKAIKDYIAPTEYGKFRGGIDIMAMTEKVPSKFVQKRLITEAKAFKTEKGVSEVIKWSKKHKGTVYGSYAARQQMPKDLARVPADIDIQLAVSEEKAVSITASLFKRLKAAGETARISKRSPTLIEIKTGGKWHHAVDIHSAEAPMSELVSSALAREGVYGFKFGQKPIKIEGVDVMRLSEQGLRKGASILTVVGEKGKIKFAPEPHRLKDIPDFFATQEALIRSRYGRFSIFPTQKQVMAKLTELKGYYPKDVLGAGKPGRALLYAPSKVTPPSIMSAFIGSGSVGVILPSMSYPSVSRPSDTTISASISRSVSRSLGYSPSYTKSISKSISQSISKSIGSVSQSSISASVSRPVSIPSPSSISASISRSISPRISPPSPSPYPSYPSYPSFPKRLSSPFMVVGYMKIKDLYPSKAAPGKGFDVFVKRRKVKKGKGKYLYRGYRKANVNPLPRTHALGLGASITDKFVNRSFKILPSVSRKPMGSRPNMGSAWTQKKHKFRYKFRKGTKIPGILVEKSKHAIDSPQERAGIPYKAARMRRAGIIPYAPGRKGVSIRKLMGV